MPHTLYTDAAWTLFFFAIFCVWFYIGKAIVQSPWYSVRAFESGGGPSPSAAERVQQLAHKRLRATSWLVGLLSSLTLSSVSAYSTFSFLSQFAISIPATVRWLESDDPIGRLISCFFIASLFADIILGLLHYPTLIDMLQGWIHHSAYFALLVWFLHNGWTNIFFAFSLLEVPTLILALGSVYPPWRQDLCMGVLFFLTRIGYFSMVAFVVSIYCQGIVLKLLTILVFALHVYWFVGWVRSYGRTRAGKRRGGKGGNKSDSDIPATQNHVAQPGATGTPPANPPVDAATSRSETTTSAVPTPGSKSVKRGTRAPDDAASASPLRPEDCDDVTRLLDDYSDAADDTPSVH